MIISESLDATKSAIPTLAVQILAAKHDLTTMPYDEMLKELHSIVSSLMETAEDTLPR